MTTDDTVPPLTAAGAGDAGGYRTHRLLPDEKVRERFAAKPAVAEWILAVRSELVERFGDVGTLSKFAQHVKVCRPNCASTVDQLRRRLSEQLTQAPGPSAKTAEYVLRLVVADEHRAVVTARFAELYEATHEGAAPFATAPNRRTAPTSSVQPSSVQPSSVQPSSVQPSSALPDPAPPDPGPVGPELTGPGVTSPGVTGQAPTPAAAGAGVTATSGTASDPTTTGELRELVAELQRRLEASALHKADLMTQLVAKHDEARRLRLHLVRLNAAWRARSVTGAMTDTSPAGAELLSPELTSPGLTRTGTPTADPTMPVVATGPGRVPVPRVVVPVDPPLLRRPVPMVELQALDGGRTLVEVSAPGRARLRDELEEFWLGPHWHDLRRRRPERLDPQQVASKFGAIARTLAEEGVGADVGTASPPLDYVTAPGAAVPPVTSINLRGQEGRDDDPRDDRVPAEWTSRGPTWFYALLGALMLAGLAAGVAMTLMCPPPSLQEDDNILVSVLQRPVW
jgi:hypothetical protein